MFRWIWTLFFGKKLDEALDLERTIRIKGVKFKIKKINVLNYLDGSKVMLQHFDIYKAGLAEGRDVTQSQAKIKEHLTDVIMAGVVKPKLSRKEDGDGVFVDKLFNDWDLVNGLYENIMALAYGKKKLSPTH